MDPSSSVNERVTLNVGSNITIVPAPEDSVHSDGVGNVSRGSGSPRGGARAAPRASQRSLHSITYELRFTRRHDLSNHTPDFFS